MSEPRPFSVADLIQPRSDERIDTEPRHSLPRRRGRGRMTDLERAKAAFLAATPDGEVILTMTERAAKLMAAARQEGAEAEREKIQAEHRRCRAVASLVLIPVQDGMEHADLAPLVGPNVGIFLGGSTPWKLARMADWGLFCAEHRVHYHVARVNTMRRMFTAIAAGAHSIDGSSVSRYAVNLPKLDGASRHRDLFAIAHTDAC